jgi:hypothetical protein
MNTNYKEIVYNCYDYGMTVQECLNVLNTEFGGFTCSQVADMYMEIECEEEGK